MTDTDPSLDQRVQDLIDTLLPRRDPRYAPAYAFAIALLTTPAPVQRLVRKALRNDSPDPEGTESASPPVVPAAPSRSGEIAAPATSPIKALLSCGGKACETRNGKDIHRDDPSCGHLHPKRART